MLTGIDTSFFYALAEGNNEALGAWTNGKLLTSALCLYELQKRMLKGDLPGWPLMIENIEKAVEVVPVTGEIARLAGHVAHGTGMPAFDAIIITCLVASGCEEVLTADTHFLKFKKKGFKIRLLS